MILFEAVAFGVLGMATLYAGAWLVSRAYFSNKLQYHRDVLQHLDVVGGGKMRSTGYDEE